MAQLYILAAIVLWSSLGIVIRTAGISIFSLIFYSLLVSSVLQGLYIFRQGYFREVSRSTGLKYPFLLGVLSAGNMVSYYYAFRTTSIANAVLTHYTAPVIVAVLAIPILKEPLNGPLIMAIALASSGLWAMLDGPSFGRGESLGIIAGLISGLFYALIVIAARRYAYRYRPVMLSFLVNGTILVLVAPLVRETPVGALGSIIIMGVLHSTVAPILYYRGLHEVTAGRTAALGYLEPLCAILLGMMLLDEQPGPHTVLGGSLILGSGYLTLMGGRGEKA